MLKYAVVDAALAVPVVGGQVGVAEVEAEVAGCFSEVEHDLAGRSDEGGFVEVGGGADECEQVSAEIGVGVVENADAADRVGRVGVPGGEVADGQAADFCRGESGEVEADGGRACGVAVGA